MRTPKFGARARLDVASLTPLGTQRDDVGVLCSIIFRNVMTELWARTMRARRYGKWGLLGGLLVIGLLVGGCTSADSVDCTEVTADNADQCVRLNQLQVLGTHNSYHIQPHEKVVEALRARGFEADWGRNLEYTHRPLSEQLGELGMRQIELDVFADPEGGRYAQPLGRDLTGHAPEVADSIMQEPGYKVLHVQDIDYRSRCPTLVDCLQEVRRWSLETPDHVPVMVLIEVKDGTLPDTLGLDFTEPISVGAEQLDALDEEIRSVFREDHLITPDDVRGDYDTLDEAIQTEGWPTLAEARGRILLALDNTGRHRDLYLEGHPTLRDRVLFVSSPPGEPSAGFIKMNDPLGENTARIRDRVEAGYLVRTRADVPTQQARSGDTTRREAALSSGAQYVSTDYPEPSPFDSTYVVTLPGAEGVAARCNPVDRPPGCAPGLIAR